MMRCRQSGVAVVLAVLLTALATGAAAFMLSQQDLYARQVENLAARAQADALARFGIDWAARGLDGVDGLPEPRVFAAGGADLRIEYADAQASFNINNLVRGDQPNEGEAQVLRRLLAATKLPPELSHAVIDAIDGDSDTRHPGGAEDLEYLAMEPPRRAANRPLLDAAHLARLKGFGADAFTRLQPWVIALPEATALNVNTAPVPLLAAAIPGLDARDALKLAEAREQAPFADLAAFRAKLPEQASLPSGVALDVKSRYLLATSRARSGNVEVAYRALIGRTGAARTGVVWRKQVED